MASPSPARRAVSLLSWLVVAGLLIRIGVADGTLDLRVPEPRLAVVEIGIGLVLLAAALALATGFAIGAPWSGRFSRAAALLAVPYGLSLLAASHQSGSLVALAGLSALLAGLVGLPARRPPA